MVLEVFFKFADRHKRLGFKTNWEIMDLKKLQFAILATLLSILQLDEHLTDAWVSSSQNLRAVSVKKFINILKEIRRKLQRNILQNVTN